MLLEYISGICLSLIFAIDDLNSNPHSPTPPRHSPTPLRHSTSRTSASRLKSYMLYLNFCFINQGISDDYKMKILINFRVMGIVLFLFRPSIPALILRNSPRRSTRTQELYTLQSSR